MRTRTRTLVKGALSGRVPVGVCWVLFGQVEVISGSGRWAGGKSICGPGGGGVWETSTRDRRSQDPHLKGGLRPWAGPSAMYPPFSGPSRSIPQRMKRDVRPLVSSSFWGDKRIRPMIWTIFTPSPFPPPPTRWVPLWGRGGGVLAI